MFDRCGAGPALPLVTVRDARIDLFRGLAIYMILIDHIEHNPFAKFTYHSLGLSDAAEIFVFLSGISCGLAYPSVYTRAGSPGLVQALSRRTTVIYGYYVAASIATFTIVEAFGRDLHTFGFSMSFARHIWTSLDAIVSITTLSLQTPLPSVLILYIVITVCLVPLFVLLPRSSAWLLAASGLVWSVVQFVPCHAPYYAYFPTFNPLAWQFLFAIGLAMGLQSRKQQAGTPQLIDHPFVLTLAWFVVIAGMLLRFAMFLVKHGYWSNEFVDGYVLAADDMKYNLSAARIGHFLCVAVLVRAYLPRELRFEHAWSHALISAGRNALPLFSVSAVLSVVGTIIIAKHDFTFVETAAMNLALLMLLWAAGTFIARSRAFPRPGGQLKELWKTLLGQRSIISKR